MLRFTFRLFISIQLWGFGKLYAAATHRPDIESALGESLCASDPANSVLSPQRLWKKGIYDAQMEASWIQAEEPIEPQELEAAAQDQAEELHHGGYAFGRCGTKRAWIVSSPAAAPLLKKRGEDMLALNSIAMAPSCASFDVDTAAAAGGQSRAIITKQKPQSPALQINGRLLNAGTLSVTCHPPDPKLRGPELWALMPLGTWARLKFPHSETIKASDFQSLSLWLQKLRSEHGLSPLNFDQPLLSRFAGELLGYPSIRHPRPLLRTHAAELKKSKGSWLGENRVKGRSANEMAWLLWHSPQHRGLLLNAKANAIGLQISQKSPEKLLVMVLARI